jgi:hypothetical protein
MKYNVRCGQIDFVKQKVDVRCIFGTLHTDGSSAYVLGKSACK